MNIYDFVKPADFEKMRKSVISRELFAYEKESKTNDLKIKVSLEGRLVDILTAEAVWNGNDYLISFNEDHNGKKCGIGGHGYATDEYTHFCDWEHFKWWFDDNMRCFKEYQVEEPVKLVQLSLFD